jgi:hypothetical protein
MQPLDIELNRAIVEMAVRLWPEGYDVADNAPQSYEELKARLEAGDRMVVWSGASERTIYADTAVNYAFRAWHDWCHWTGQQPFTPTGEHAVCKIMCTHLKQYYGPTLKTLRWCRIIIAEVWGQQEHFYKYGRYPEDQRAFVEAYLNDPGQFSQVA